MSTQPVPHQQPYATPAGQHAPVRDLVIHQPIPLEPYGERQPVVYVPSAENPNVMVGVPKQYVQPMLALPARDLTPQPLIDPGAQKMIGGGIGVGAAGAGLGWGAGQMFAGIALMGTAGAVIVVGLLILSLNIRGRASSGGDTYVTHNHASWWAKTTTDNN